MKCQHIMFEPGDWVFYTPNMSVRPISQRPWDVGTVLSIEGVYVNIRFGQGYESLFLPEGIQHHPLSPKAIRQQMAAVLPDIVAAVEGRVAVLVFSELTGQTAQRGFGPADVLRSFLDPRPKRKHRYIA